MKHIYVLLFPLLALSGSSSAQYLTENITAANPLLLTRKTAGSDLRVWQKEGDRVNGHISSGKLAKMKNVTEAVVAYFHDSCITDGRYSPSWHGEYFSEKRGSGKELRFSVQCNFYDQKANLAILAGDLSSLLMEPLKVNGGQFLAMRAVKGLKKDCAYFDYSAGDDGNTTGGNANDANITSGNANDANGTRCRVWLLSMVRDQLPFIPVTRAAYLKEARLELIAIKAGIAADITKNIPVRAAGIQEADKKAALDQLATLYSGMDLQVRTKMFLSSYHSDEDYLKENIAKGTAALDSTLALMDRLLNHSRTEDLNKPAIVSVQAADFRGFEDGYGEKMLVKVNPACYVAAGADAGGEEPRFLLVRWQYDPSEAMAGAIDKDLQEKFDAEKLKDALHCIIP